MISTPYQISFGGSNREECDGWGIRVLYEWKKRRGVYRVLVSRTGGTESLGRPRCRWEDKIQMNLQDVGWDMDWINLAQDRNKW
jgi:hypothetical protein